MGEEGGRGGKKEKQREKGAKNGKRGANRQGATGREIDGRGLENTRERRPKKGEGSEKQEGVKEGGRRGGSKER